ncbi:putative glycine hydroxymethyltransferase [Helianthus debilis subsp. tardiflorus]
METGLGYESCSDSGFVPTPPTVTIVCEKRNTIGTFGSLLSGSYFGADGLRNFSFDPGPNRIYKRYFNYIIHIFEPIDTVVLEFGTSILVHQGLSALRLYFLDDDPNPTDACTTITDKYSAGMPSAWYYNTNQYMNEIETLCCQLASVVSELHSDSWGVNVQPYSGTTTNFAAYTGLLSLGDRIIGFYTPLGWHTSHGYYTPNGQNVSGASNFLETFSFKVDLKTCVVDFEEHDAWAVNFHPKILVCGWIIFHRKSYKPTKRGVLLHQNNGNDQYGLEVNIYFVACPSLHGGPHHNHNADLGFVFSSSVELPWKPPLCFFYFARDQLLGWNWGTLKLVFSMAVVANAVRDPPDFLMVPYRAFGYVMVQPFELKVVSQGKLSSSLPCCISRGCFITVAWVRCPLIKGSDDLKCLTCDNLLTTIVQYAHLGTEFEEWFLACLCISHYTFDKGALKLTNLSAGVNKSPRRHLNIPWIVEKLSKLLSDH